MRYLGSAWLTSRQYDLSAALIRAFSHEDLLYALVSKGFSWNCSFLGLSSRRAFFRDRPCCRPMGLSGIWDIHHPSFNFSDESIQRRSEQKLNSYTFYNHKL